MKLAVRAFVANADVLGRNAGECDKFATKPSLLPEDATSSALTGQAVANRDAHGLAIDLGGELTTTAGSKTVRHRRPSPAPDYVVERPLAAQQGRAGGLERVAASRPAATASRLAGLDLDVAACMRCVASGPRLWIADKITAMSSAFGPGRLSAKARER